MSSSEHHEISDHPTYKILSLILGVLIGLVFVGLAFFKDPKLCEFVHQLLFSIGMGILLSVFGTQISGKYERWSLAGAGGIALILFLAFFFYHTPENCSAGPSGSEVAGPSGSEVADPSGSEVADPSGSESAPPPAQVRIVCPSPASVVPEGWVYVGINLGRHWDKKHFNWDSYNRRLPEKADILTATALVNLRKRFGEHAPIVDVICPDEQVQALETKTLSNSYHWVKVKRTRRKQDSL